MQRVQNPDRVCPGETQRGTPAGTGSTAEQRRAERRRQKRTLHIRPVVDGELGGALPTRAQDFSAMGIGLIHSRRMSAGEEFALPLETRSDEPVHLLYSVVRCDALKNGLFFIGAQLIRVMERSKAEHCAGSPQGIEELLLK